MSHVPTASQTVGPFFNFGLTTNADLGSLVRPGVEGRRIRLAIRVIDGDGVPTPGDSMVELWQADSAGVYAYAVEADSTHAPFSGFGRLETDREGCCTFETIKPGRVPAAEGGLQAPHINVIVFARGLLRHLHTRIYFAGEPANSEDTVLALVPEERRETLMARPSTDDPDTWRFEIVLQGVHETVFFDV
jgi:protocatechuate 3,4-dioxygenase alpha subunit